MGVTGLWRLVEPSGKPVPLETLENRILAIDISIWLHQAIKGFQDSQGAAVPNAHLLGIYHRVCKLLYFRIKPIFVFDGGVPLLKRETIIKRQQLRSKKITEAERIQKQLLTTLLKHAAVKNVLSEKTKATLKSPKKSNSPKESDDLYKLPSVDFNSSTSSDEETDESPAKTWDLHTIDEKSVHFKSLPADVRHDILTDLKETRKQSSWGRLHELPKNSDDFSGFQMKRLLKRNSVQMSLEEAAKEMGGRSLSLAELEALLKDHGVETLSSGSRIASDENARYLLIKDVKKAMYDAKLQESTLVKPDSKLSPTESLQDDLKTSKPSEIEELEEISKQSLETESEYQRDLEAAIQLSLQDVPSTSKDEVFKKTEKGVFIENFQDGDFETSSDSDIEETSLPNKNLATAKNYMMEYSGLTPIEINKIIGKNVPPKKKSSNIIEVITSSDSSDDDFLEVPANSEKTKEFDVVIQPDQSVREDDLFSDIFCGSNESVTQGLENDQNIHVSCDENKNMALELQNDQTQKDVFCDTTLQLQNDHKGVQNVDTKSQQIETEDHICNKQVHLEINNSKLKDAESNNTQSNVPQENSNTNSETEKPAGKDFSILNQTESITNNNVPDATSEKIPASNHLTVEDLQDLAADLTHKKIELQADRFAQERLANNLTDQVYQEAQELLQLFGVPYIIAPMEAEAQCAFLDSINLTNGTITDDSDIWLFGGRTVYKNFFNQRKHVLEYRLERIQQNFKLAREQMVLLALLVGSDYTTGLQGVGPVTALEIIAKFPSADDIITSGLATFRQWLSADKTGRNVTLRNKLKNVVFTESFPSAHVVNAYLEPVVDKSEEAFSWGKPDINGLVEFARQKFGWNRLKSEEILKPVLKQLSVSVTQRSIKDFFQTKHKIDGGEAEAKMSKRVKKAVEEIGKSSGNSEESDAKHKSQKRKKVDEEIGKSSNNSKPKSRKSKTNADDKGLKLLKKTIVQSKRKVKQIQAEAEEEIKKPKVIPDVHKKEVIPQREQDKVDVLRSRLKAIEVLRKSKKGPGHVKKRTRVARKVKVDAELSESSSD